MARKSKLLVFLTARFEWKNGGVLWAKTLLENLARVPGVDCTVVSSGYESTRFANQAFADLLGFNHIFIPFCQECGEPTGVSVAGIGDAIVRKLQAVARIAVDKYYFSGERLWRKQKHVDSELRAIIEEQRPDLVLIDNTFSAFFVPSAFSTGVPCCLVTQDNDIPFYKSLKAQGGAPSMSRFELWIFRRFNTISYIRVHRHVNRIYKQCSAIVTLTKNDMPRQLRAGVVRAAIPPVLREKDLKWRYCGSRRVLFVGSMFVGEVMHFANRLAIEWICCKLAPDISRLDSEVRINIIGAERGQVPESWRSSNVNFMGKSNQTELVRQLTTADMFVAPIATAFGAKMKLAECVSYGMPFVATAAALSGLPFLTCTPQIDLHNPGGAARLILEYTNNPERLRVLSESILAAARQGRVDQDVAWTNFIADCLGRRCGAGTMERTIGFNGAGNLAR